MSLGLKTITTRNLALAWRSLQLLLTLMPRVSTHFSALLGPEIVEKHIDLVNVLNYMTEDTSSPFVFIFIFMYLLSDECVWVKITLLLFCTADK